MRFDTSKRLKEYMSAYNLRQVDILNRCKPLCEKLGIKLTKSMMSQYISGRVSPGKQKLYVIAKSLNVSQAWLLGLDDSKDNPLDESAIILAEAAQDAELIGYIDKLMVLPSDRKIKAYGYIDALIEAEI